MSCSLPQTTSSPDPNLIILHYLISFLLPADGAWKNGLSAAWPTITRSHVFLPTFQIKLNSPFLKKPFPYHPKYQVKFTYYSPPEYSSPLLFSIHCCQSLHIKCDYLINVCLVFRLLALGVFLLFSTSKCLAHLVILRSPIFSKFILGRGRRRRRRETEAE